MPSAGNPEGIKTKGKWKKENTEELVFPSYTKWLERKAVPVYYPSCPTGKAKELLGRCIDASMHRCIDASMHRL
jgi:hypothetical protein